MSTGMRATRKKTKHIHASAADLLHTRPGNLDWCKCGHCRYEAREIDCLCCIEVNAMLIASAKIPERTGSNCLTVSHTCLLYLPRRWVFLSVPDVTEWNEYAGWIWSFIFLFLVLIRWNEEGRWVQDFLLLPQGFESLPSDLPRARWRNLVYVVLVDD